MTWLSSILSCSYPPLAGYRSIAFDSDYHRFRHGNGQTSALPFYGMVLVCDNYCTGSRNNSDLYPCLRNGRSLPLPAFHRHCRDAGMGNTCSDQESNIRKRFYFRRADFLIIMAGLTWRQCSYWKTARISSIMLPSN